MTDPKRIVQQGYDAIAQRYLAWSGEQPSPPRRRALETLRAAVPPDSWVLDLGCGAGIPMTATLAERYQVHGVDISARQIALATAKVPTATFQQADMATVHFDDASFDAVVSFYALTHLPRDEHGPLLSRVRRWLRPGGLFLASMGAHDDPGTVEPEWLGAPMYFSHHDAATNRRSVVDAGLELIEADVVTELEDGRPIDFLWVLARRPAGRVST